MNSMMPTLSLLELCQQIKRTLNNGLGQRLWIRAEINKINVYKASGHAFLELVDKKEGQMLAQLKAVIWKNDFLAINSAFIKITGQSIKDGMAVLCEVEVMYDPIYGLSLRITRVDPSYSLGELEKEKQECLRRLKDELLFDKNRQLPKPLLIQRLAIISVENSKGFSDFKEKIDKNPWNYAFFYQLFPALLQGDQAIASITRQLKRIEKVKHHFDAVAIIRGGGDDAGLSCYNSYILSKAIANFPLPVLSGIGHSTNETIVEMITAQNAITPTDLADYLLQRFHNVSVPLQNAVQSIKMNSSKIIQSIERDFSSLNKILINLAKSKIFNEEVQLEKQQEKTFKSPNRIIQEKKELIKKTAISMSFISDKMITKNEVTIQKSILTLHQQCQQIEPIHLTKIQQHNERLKLKIERMMEKSNFELELLSQRTDLLDPQTILNRGFSISTKNGKVIKSSTELSIGDRLETRLKEGTIISRIDSKK